MKTNVYFWHSAKISSAVSTAGSKVTASSLDRQFHDSADFDASLNSILI